MISRMIGEIPTIETRSEANQKVDRNKRYRQILEVLEEKPMTAKEVAVVMMHKGYIPTSERNFTAPRLTELCQQGKVDQVGKKVCAYTHKTVAVYAKREAQNG